ncbi:MAG: hypothetical protein Ct9H300mP1_35060 [Planctomycetaceae bacterium]|nr:MAG: hypothetical protein Ct9H300mP1_35060 [Planctomycetaceae bacterium]
MVLRKCRHARPADCGESSGPETECAEPVLVESIERRFGLPVVLAAHDQEAAFGRRSGRKPMRRLA